MLPAIPGSWTGMGAPSPPPAACSDGGPSLSIAEVMRDALLGRFLDANEDQVAAQQVANSAGGITFNEDQVASPCAEISAQIQQFMPTLEAAAKEAAQQVANANASEDRKPLPGKETKAKVLLEAVDKGDVDLRSGIGQQFAAWLKANPHELENYNKAGKTGSKIEAKKAFRVQWAKTQLDQVTTVKQKLEKFQIVDEEIGTYEPLEMIAKYEGGKDSPSAWQAALNYASMCCKLGGKWLDYNTFTKRVDILYVKKTQRSAFTRSWTLYQEHLSKQKDTSDVAIADTAATAEQETPLKTVAPKAKAKAKATAKATPRKRAAEGDPEEAPEAKLATNNAKLLKMCAALKQLFHMVVSMHASRTKSLEENPSWAEVATKTVKDNLAKLAADLQAAVQDPFVDEYLTQEWQTIRQKNVKDMGTVYYKLKVFHDEVGSKVKALDAELSKLNKRYMTK